MTKWRRENGWVAVQVGAGWRGGRAALHDRRHGVSAGFPDQQGLPSWCDETSVTAGSTRGVGTERASV